MQRKGIRTLNLLSLVRERIEVRVTT